MASKFAGLFGGASPGDIRSLMEQENQARVRQAFLDQTKAGGGPLAANAARYREQGLQGLDRMLGAGAGMMDMEIPQDPRMVRASKREKDKNEILRTLDSYITNDGVMSEEEIRQGWSLLMSRGYQNEAKEFRAMAEMMARKETAKSKADSADGFKSTGSTIYQTRGNKKYAVTPGVKDGKPILLEVELKGGELLGKRFRDISEYGKIAGAEQGAKEKQKIKTIKFKEKLERETLNLKKVLNIEEDSAKELASLKLKDRSDIINSGLTAVEDLPKLRALVDLARLRKEGKTGGELEASFRRLGRAFGFEDKPFADFRVGSQNLMIENLKRIFGPRATDKDMEELKKAFANENQTYEGNVSILESLLKKYEKEVNNTEFLRNNPLAGKDDLFDYVRGGRKVPTEIAINLLKQKRAELRNNPKEWKKITKQFTNRFGRLALKKALKNRD